MGAKATFNQYINRLRVKAFKQRLQSSSAEGRSLLDLAFEGGFNSKSSFNAIFRGVVGMTPSQYVKNGLVEGAGVGDGAPM